MKYKTILQAKSGDSFRTTSGSAIIKEREDELFVLRNAEKIQRQSISQKVLPAFAKPLSNADKHLRQEYATALGNTWSKMNRSIKSLDNNDFLH